MRYFVIFLVLFLIFEISASTYVINSERFQHYIDNGKDVCFNDDFDFTSNEIKKTIPISNQESLELIENLNNSMHCLNLNPYLNHFKVSDSACYSDENCARKWMSQANFVFGKLKERASYLSYQYSANVTDENNKLLQEFAPISARANRILFNNGRGFNNFSQLWEPKLKRMLFLTRQSDLSDPEVVRITNELTGIYAKATVCKPNSKNCLSLEPGLSQTLALSRDNDELKWAWNEWYAATGPKMKGLYLELVDYLNKAAKEKGHKDASEDWINELETDNFEQIVDSLYEQLRPFYEQLHAYVRRKLRSFYGPSKVRTRKIPIHLLGNMWGQSWENIEDIVMPYPNEKTVNITEKLIQNQYTPLKMFQESENFFASLGLCNMTKTFWKYSDIVKSTDRESVCHASAFDFSNPFDFRIKMCTEVNEEYFYTVHHEMGHIEYFMAYRNQPTAFRDGANSAFHEAIGDTVALSVLTRKHLKQINLIDDDQMTNEQTINFLMSIALKKIAFLPFGYLIDKWRWNVFRGVIRPQYYNQVWWKMINEIQGLEAPSERGEEFFDAGAKFHIPANVPYIRYFISLFHQFQFYKGLCNLSGHTGPLHTCDFYNSKEAGSVFKQMLSLGSSEHWTYSLHLLTGYKTVKVDAVLEYFKPLMVWLKAENLKYKNDPVGW